MNELTMKILLIIGMSIVAAIMTLVMRRVDPGSKAYPVYVTFVVIAFALVILFVA